MISYGRCGYHLDNIEEIETMAQPLDPINKLRLSTMKQEVEEFEAKNPEEMKVILARRAEQKAMPS